MSTQPETSHRRNLTRDRARLRNLHDSPRPPQQITYRNHLLQRETTDNTQSGCYRILDDTGEAIDTIEPSDFVHADDWVRYIDLLINKNRETAKHWLKNHLGWNREVRQ